MARRASFISLLPLPFLLIAPTSAGIDSDLELTSSPKSGLFSKTQPSRWSFGIGGAQRFDLKANFRGLGGYVAGLPLPGPGNTVFGEYDDGFVRPDISGLSDSTTFWNYQNSLQYETNGTGTLALSISDVPGRASLGERENALGIDFFVRREMGRLQLGRYESRWGVIGRLNYSRIDLTNRQSLSLASRQTTDRFPLLGVIPPLSPYTGSFTGPGPLLGTNATRSNSLMPGGAIVSGSRNVDADLFVLSFGPWMEFSPLGRLSVQLEAGISLAVIDGSFSQTSVTTVANTANRTSSRGSDSDFLFGLYLGAGASYSLTESWDIYLNARYEHLDDFSIRADPARVDLSFSDSLVISSGLIFRF